MFLHGIALLSQYIVYQYTIDFAYNEYSNFWTRIFCSFSSFCLPFFLSHICLHYILLKILKLYSNCHYVIKWIKTIYVLNYTRQYPNIYTFLDKSLLLLYIIFLIKVCKNVNILLLKTCLLYEVSLSFTKLNRKKCYVKFSESFFRI